MRRTATGLAVLAFLGGGAALANATGWGGSSGGGYGDPAYVQYKKKKLCDLLVYLYNKYHHKSWTTSSHVKTGYGGHSARWIVKFCLDDHH